MFRRIREEDAMLARLFFRLLPVQAAIVAMGSINSIVDGVVASRFIDPSTVGVVGLYYTMLRILEAVGAVLLGGVSVLSGRYLGSGKIDRTRGICSLGMALAILIGALLTAASFAFPGTIADLLGANAELREPLKTYILGYAFGLIPQLLGQQIAADIQLERQEGLGNAAVAAMIVTNVLLDFLFVAVQDKGVWGLALATSLANWVYFLIVAQYYFRPKAQLK
ncbi:MAG: MATE family efflux transporter, partial [Eubacteriales bacterium]|nr:MATE family efflux transporter [Eubacteriales bacterium]